MAKIDWRRQRAFVEPSEERGKTRWFGNSRGVSARIAGAVRAVIAEPTLLDTLVTQRGRRHLAEVSEELQWTLSDSPIHVESDDWAWWTYAGTAANRLLMAKLDSIGGRRRFSDGYSLTFRLQNDVTQKIGWKAIRNLP